MTDTPDVEALVADLRKAEEYNWYPPACYKLMGWAADALERQQAVVEAAREVNADPGNQFFLIALRNAFNALDAPKEGEE